MQTLIITILVILVVGFILATLVLEPAIIITALNITPTTFRLYKPKNQGQYFLQIRVFYIYYYIYKYQDDFNLCITSDRFCIHYPNHLIISNKREVIFDNRYEIIKFFSDNSSPSDKINL